MLNFINCYVFFSVLRYNNAKFSGLIYDDFLREVHRSVSYNRISKELHNFG
jgi:hypothetical protein